MNKSPAVSKSRNLDLRKIVLTKWIPALIVGVMAGIAVPWFQEGSRAEQVRQQKAVKEWERKEELWRSIGSNAACYFDSWKKKRAYDVDLEKENSEEETEEDKERYERFVLHRDECGQRLFSDLTVGKHYFGPQSRRVIEEYSSWRSAIAPLKGSRLPSEAEHEKNLEGLVKTIYAELSNEQPIGRTGK